MAGSVHAAENGSKKQRYKKHDSHTTSGNSEMLLPKPLSKKARQKFSKKTKTLIGQRNKLDPELEKEARRKAPSPDSWELREKLIQHAQALGKQEKSHARKLARNLAKLEELNRRDPSLKRSRDCELVRELLWKFRRHLGPLLDEKPGSDDDNNGDAFSSSIDSNTSSNGESDGEQYYSAEEVPSPSKASSKSKKKKKSKRRREQDTEDEKPLTKKSKEKSLLALDLPTAQEQDDDNGKHKTSKSRKKRGKERKETTLSNSETSSKPQHTTHQPNTATSRPISRSPAVKAYVLDPNASKGRPRTHQVASQGYVTPHDSETTWTPSLAPEFANTELKSPAKEWTLQGSATSKHGSAKSITMKVGKIDDIPYDTDQSSPTRYIKKKPGRPKKNVNQLPSTADQPQTPSAGDKGGISDSLVQVLTPSLRPIRPNERQPQMSFQEVRQQDMAKLAIEKQHWRRMMGL